MSPATETPAAEPEKEISAPAEKPEGAPAEASPEESAPETPEQEPAGDPAPPAEAKAGIFNRAAAFLAGRTQLVNQLEAATKENSSLRAQLAASEAEVQRLQAAVDRAADIEATNADLKAKLEAADAAKTSLQKEVRAELTTLGIPEEKAPPVTGGDSGKPELTREEFEKLPHHERNTFMRKGGKIVA